MRCYHFPVLRLAVILFSFVAFHSCKTSRGGLFGKKTAHEKYADGLESSGLKATTLGKLWFLAAEKSLSQPLDINIPYKETGFFPAEKPEASGYRFSARRGEKISIQITTIPASETLLFAELWQAPGESGKPRLLEVADTLTGQLEYETGKETVFLFRLQPELLQSIEYTLTITVQPSLAFPVQSSGNPRLISLWGVPRDGGSRSHEGVDIAASFRTPVVAAAGGRVVSVSENNLGGKVIFLRPSGKNYNLYYAHLDSQIAKPGQSVSQGEILGLLGNTGNARNTVPHLHFGIYTGDGAIDPFPFINPDSLYPSPIKAPLDRLNQFVRNNTAATLYNGPETKAQTLEKLNPSSLMRVLSVTGNWYKVLLPGDKKGFITAGVVTTTPARKFNIQKNARLLARPDSTSPARQLVEADTSLAVLGIHEDYYFVQYKDKKGWVLK